MSDRERWVVYPLLFLALRLAMRNHVLPAKELLAERVWCGALTVAAQPAEPESGMSPVLVKVSGDAEMGGDLKVQGTLTAEQIILLDSSGRKYQLDVRSLPRATSLD